jgi:hypothetical protein
MTEDFKVNAATAYDGDENVEVELSNDTSGSGHGSSLTLLERIKQILASTPAERWEEGGEPLDSTRKFQKPQETWEQLFCTDTKNGVLVLRCSMPVKSNFFGGGYCFVESGLPNYYIEIRARGWAPKMLIDPFYRSGGGVDKAYQILADGDVARHLYIEVETSVRAYRDSLRRDFNDSVERLMGNLHEQIQLTCAADWQNIPGDKGFLGYQADVNGITLTITQIIRERSATYTMMLVKYGLKWECRDAHLMREIFAMVDGSVRHASLEHLGKVLEDML